MRISPFLLCMVIASLLGACGTGSPPTPAATLPTATPEPPTQPAVPQPTPTPDLGPQLDAAQRLADDGNFEDALDVLVPLFERHPEREEVTNLLAAVYEQTGARLLSTAGGQPVSIQDAYLMFSKGLNANPTDEELRRSLQANKDVSELLFSIAQNIEQLAALRQDKAPQEEQLQQAGAIYDLLQQLIPSYADYLAVLPPGQLLDTADVFEGAGRAETDQGAARPLYEKGKDICTWVESSLAADAPERPRAAQCREHLDLLLNPPPTPTRGPASTTPPKRLRFVKESENDTPTCISVGIRGISTGGWTFRVDGKNGMAQFDGAGNARICNLSSREVVTISVYNNQGQAVPGGKGVPSIGSAIMVANWR